MLFVHFVVGRNDNQLSWNALLFLCNLIAQLCLGGPGYMYSSWYISNGNRTEWNPIRSVIIRVINKIRGSPICLIMSMITN